MEKENPNTKSILKRITAVIMAVVMLLCVAPLEGVVEFDFSAFNLSASALEVGETFTEGFYTYEVTKNYENVSQADIGGEVKVKKVDKSIDFFQEIPSYVNGYKVTEIGNYAFYDCYNLYRITIPESVTVIGAHAFDSCKNLSQVDAPDTITKVGEDAFYNTEMEITLDDGSIFYVGNIACGRSPWGSSDDLVLKNGTRVIADEAFTLWNVDSITIPSSVEYIGYNAFETCDVYFSDLTSLLNIKFGEPDEGVADRGPIADCNLYINNSLVTDVIVPEGITDISTVFRGYKNLKSIVLPNSITEIRASAFNGCYNLANVTIPSSVQKIGYGAFRDCGLTNIIIPGSVKEIGAYAFESCDSLARVEIKNGVNIIKYLAFGKCGNLESIVIPPSIKEIWDDAFAYCYKLNKVYITDLSAWLNIDFGVGMNEQFAYSSMASPLCYDGTLYINNVKTEHLVIPEGTTKIKKGAFLGSDALRTIIIPEGVTEIEAGAFGWCNYLEGVIIPKSVKKIGVDAFRYAGHYTGCDFCYRGTEDDWNKIEIANNIGFETPKFDFSDDSKYDENVLVKFELGKNNNSFRHSHDSFFNKKEKNQYKILPEHYERLISYYDENTGSWLSTVELDNYMQKKLSQEWGGSCFGLSVSMALAYTGDIDISNFVENADVYFEAKEPKYNVEFRSLIDYYHLSQYLPSIDDKHSSVFKNEDEYQKELNDIVNKAMESEKTLDPFIFSFFYAWYTENWYGKRDWTQKGHAIICVGCETTSDNYRLKFVDPNSEKFIYANIPFDYKSIEFESIYTPKKNNGKKDKNGKIMNDWQIIGVGINDLSDFKSIDIDGVNNDCIGTQQYLKNGNNNKSDLSTQSDTIIFDSDTKFELVVEDGRKICFDGLNLTGDLEVLDKNIFVNSENLEYKIQVEPHRTYSVKQLDENIDLSIRNVDDIFYSFEGTDSEEIIIDMDKGIVATGDNMKNSVYCSVNSENVDMIKITNENSDKVTAVINDNDIIFSGDNMCGIEVVGFSKGSKTNLSVDNMIKNEMLVLETDKIHVHNYGVTTIEGNCTENGVVEYSCSCGYNYTDVIDATGHTEETIPAVPATYTKAGLTEGKKCSSCGEILVEQKIVARKKLKKVVSLKAKKTTANSVTLTWKKAEGADSYKVYYSTNGKKWKSVKVKKNTATIKKLSTAKNYQFKVRAYAGKYYGDASKVVKTTTKFTTAKLSSVKSTKKKTALVSWKKVTDASGYIVEYSTSKKFTKKTTKKVTIKKGKTTKTILKKLKSGKKYYVRVRAFKTVNKKTVYGSYSSVKMVKVK